MANKLDYYNGTNLMNEGDIRISASSIARYITDTRAFWGELMLNEQGFTSSTASILGTCCHFGAEDYVKTGDVDGEEVEDYIDQETSKNQEADGAIIREQYPIMMTKLINDYVIPNPPSFIEEFMLEQLIPASDNHGAIYVGGSCDAISVPGIVYDADQTSLDIGPVQQSIIIDYKTTSATSLPDRIPYAYRLQLLTYAYLYSKRGVHSDRIRIVYVTRNNVGRISPKTGKPLKSYPTQVKVLTESITESDYEYIEGMLSVISRSIRLWETHPELRSIIAQDNRIT